MPPESVDDEILAPWREELQRLRLIVDKTWQTERPKDGGNLRLMERFALVPERLSPEESRKAEELMELSPQLRRDVAELRKYKDQVPQEMLDALF